MYEENTGTLNQRASDLDFVKQLARTNNLSFWISYKAESGGLNPLAAGSLTVEEIANFTSSPPRPEGGLDLPLPSIPLVASTSVALRVNVEAERCQNVTSFDLNVDSERAAQFNGSAVDDRSVQKETTAAQDTQPPIFQGGDPLPSVASAERTVCLTVAGNQEELQTRSEAALTDAGWFVTASANNDRAPARRDSAAARRRAGRGSRDTRQRRLSGEFRHAHHQRRRPPHGSAASAEFARKITCREHGRRNPQRDAGKHHQPFLRKIPRPGDRQ